MLDTSDIRHFVIPKIRETILYINRYEKAAEAIAAIVGMGASYRFVRSCLTCRKTRRNWFCGSANWLSYTASSNRTTPIS